MNIIMILLLLMPAAIACGESASETKSGEAALIKTGMQQYDKSDLKKIKWIEGKWRGLYNGIPFFEIYRFVNDTTLEITGYEWNGKDSSKSTLSLLYYKDRAYLLGDKQNWKVTSITETEIKMLRNVEANNDIIWRYKDSLAWDALLEHKGGTTIYNMESF